MNRMNPCNTRNCTPTTEPPTLACSDMAHSVRINDHPLAMAYVPKQHYHQMFDLCKGLQMGTIFPELCLPFCGVRGKSGCQVKK